MVLKAYFKSWYSIHAVVIWKYYYHYSGDNDWQSAEKFYQAVKIELVLYFVMYIDFFYSRDVEF